MVPTAGLLDIEVVPIEFETVRTPSKMEVISHTRGYFEKFREGGEFKAVKQQTDMAHFSRSGKLQAYNTARRRVQYKDGGLSFLSSGHNLPSLSNAMSKGHSSARSISQMAFEYTPEEVSFNWVRDERIMQYTPEKIQRFITQYPDVLIDYLGGPIYCPPSSDPNYVEPEYAMNMVV